MKTLPTKKDNRGGARAGAGRKAVDGTKKAVTIRLYDAQVAELKAKYGSVQKAMDSL